MPQEYSEFHKLHLNIPIISLTSAQYHPKMSTADRN